MGRHPSAEGNYLGASYRQRNVRRHNANDTGDRVGRPVGQCRSGGSAAEIYFPALLNDRQEDLASFDQRRAARETRGHRRLGIRAYGLRRGDRSARAGEREVRVPGEVGHRPAVGARALSDRKAREPWIPAFAGMTIMNAKPLTYKGYSSATAAKGGKPVSIQPQFGDVARVLF
jgi:hypothetical protein